MTDVDLPRWQLESIYPGLDSKEFTNDRNALTEAVEQLERFLDDRRVRASAAGGRIDDAAPTVEALVERLNGLYTTFRTLLTYLGNRLSVDAADDAARSQLSSLDPLRAKLGALVARITAWTGELDVDAIAATSPTLREHLYALRQLKAEALHLMGEEAEALAAALSASGGSAWERLHTDLVSRRTLDVRLPDDDAPRSYGLAELGVRLSDERAEVRAAAFEALTTLLDRDAMVFAAALNGVKGHTLEVLHRRGWDSVLDATLFDNAIDRASLDAMRTATAEAAPVMRRYLRAKARYLGHDVLRWQDLRAPVTRGEPRRFTWEEAKAFVLERFGNYSDRLAGFAERAFREGWVDVPPRPGKRNGAFCSPVFGRRESRVMLNFGGRLSDVFTLAHELGHGYHNDCLYRYERTPLQAQLPMTLAETASIFCETLVMNGLLAESDEAMELAVLEQDLNHTSALILDIDARFRFESAVFEARRQRALAAPEIDAMMLEAQEASYGDALAQEGRHRLAWADKPHYYFSSRSFYNYPYTFGFLFGRGLYSVYEQDPEAFLEDYDRLLASTGMAEAADLAGEFGIDIRDPGFWRSALAATEDRVARYESLVGAATP